MMIGIPYTVMQHISIDSCQFVFEQKYCEINLSGEKFVTKVEDDFILHVATAHRIPMEWIQRWVPNWGVYNWRKYSV